MNANLASLCTHRRLRPGRLASRPTQAAPGSHEKLAVLALRAACGEGLFHPEDREGVATRGGSREGRLDGRRVEIW